MNRYQPTNSPCRYNRADTNAIAFLQSLYTSVSLSRGRAEAALVVIAPENGYPPYVCIHFLARIATITILRERI